MSEQTITDIEGVFASGIHAGIKKDAARRDLAFIYVPNGVAAAGTYTQNKFRAPCIEHTRRQLAAGTLRAVIINSGNANAATGEQGFANARRTSELAGALLGLPAEQVGTASTGIIGVQLPMDRIERGLSTLLADPRARDARSAAEAIMTTDAYRKESFLQGSVGGTTATVGGFAKGAGMIAPNMATMLAFLVTDVAVDQPLLQEILSDAVDRTFNMISVDSDTSTNDMVLLFSTGRKRVTLTDSGVLSDLSRLVTAACEDLAKLIARDGEGAQKLIEAVIRGARSVSDAKRIAHNVINSPLVKTAVHGADPNWGRVLMAIGKDPAVEVDPAKVDIYFDDLQLLRQGMIAPFDRTEARARLAGETVRIIVDLNLGSSEATGWGCDLTKKYIDINTEYS